MNTSSKINKNHYSANYNSKKRWISYWYQIQEVLDKKPNNVLEIGIGNKIVSEYLRNNNINVVTVDIDKYLKPDYICDVTKLCKIFNQKTFHVVLCAEVLEHIPFQYFEKALNELRKVSSDYVIISLPHFKISFYFELKIPLFESKNVGINIPYPKKHVFDGEHYWEIGKDSYSLKLISSKIKKYFHIEKSYLVDEHPYHRIFVLKRKEEK